MHVLVINDFVRKGGARKCTGCPSTCFVLARASWSKPSTSVHCPMSTAAGAHAHGHVPPRALVTLLERFRPQRILVHNYHNLLSSAILPVLARYKRHSGCGLFMTAHDYHLLFYNPSLLIYPGGRAQPLPIDQLHRGRRIALAAPRGVLHDVAKKLHWHAVNALFDPLGLFDEILCPSPFMRDLIAQCGRTRATLVPNPIDSTLIPHPPKPVRGDRLDLAFVGRVDADKGRSVSRAHERSGWRCDCVADRLRRRSGAGRPGETARDTRRVGAAAFRRAPRSCNVVRRAAPARCARVAVDLGGKCPS